MRKRELRPPGGRSWRVVIVGLEPSLAQPLRDALARLGGGVIAVEASGSALPEQADLVFCEARSQAIAEARHHWAHTPIVAVGRLAEADVWLESLEAGAADYCVPPFEAAGLEWMLECQLGRSAGSRPGQGRNRAARASGA